MKLAILLIFILLTKFLDSKKRNAKQIENTEERITTRQSTSQFSKSSKQVFFKCFLQNYHFNTFIFLYETKAFSSNSVQNL